MRCTHFYHLFSGGDHWRDALAEHLWALNESGFDGQFHVGVVGPPESRAEALSELHWIRRPDSVTEADEGWEQVTVRAMREWLKTQHSGAVLYAHTKGAYDASPINVQWRQSMTHHVILGWRNCARLLNKYEAAGCHWLTPERFAPIVASPFFGGTYWMAQVKYLKRLPECPETSRHDAEMWIGLGNPKVADLLPGWPGSPPFDRHKTGRLIAGQPVS